MAIAVSGRSSIPVRCSAPWPDDITCGVTIANPPTIAPPRLGRSSAGSLIRSSTVSKKLTPTITTMPNSAIARPTSAANSEVLVGDRGDLGRDDAELHRGEAAGDVIAEQCRDPDRREVRHRVVSDHQLEAVKRAGERRAERPGDAAGGAAADQHAQIGAAQAERTADPRGDAARELGVAGLHADRGADAARPHGLERDDQAPDRATSGRHAAHWPRSGRPRAPAASGRGNDRRSRAPARRASAPRRPSPDRGAPARRGAGRAAVRKTGCAAGRPHCSSPRRRARPGPDAAASTTRPVSRERTKARNRCGASNSVDDFRRLHLSESRVGTSYYHPETKCVHAVPGGTLPGRVFRPGTWWTGVRRHRGHFRGRGRGAGCRRLRSFGF